MSHALPRKHVGFARVSVHVEPSGQGPLSVQFALQKGIFPGLDRAQICVAEQELPHASIEFPTCIFKEAEKRTNDDEQCQESPHHRMYSEEKVLPTNAGFDVVQVCEVTLLSMHRVALFTPCRICCRE